MAKRRGNGEGAIAKRANGTYEGKITITDPLTGARKRVSVYGPTAPVVRAKMKVLRARVDAGAPVRDATATVADWLARWRATTLAVSGRKEATRSLYATLSRKHLEAPPFGAIPLDKLRPADIEALLLGLRERGLSQSTVRQVFIVARLGLDGAVRDGLIATNPASRVQAPGVTPREAVHLSAADVAALLAACESSRYHRALVLIAATGLRRGEAFALPWSAVDLDAGLLRVVATVGRIDGRLVTSAPKTAKSRRTVPLDETVVAMLRRHRVEQKAERLAAHTWTERGLVFTDENGALGRPAHRAAGAAGRSTAAFHRRGGPAHPAALRGGRLARARGPHQGRERSPRPFIDRDHRRRVRAHVRRGRPCGDHRAGRAARAVVIAAPTQRRHATVVKIVVLGPAGRPVRSCENVLTSTYVVGLTGFEPATT
jgi:integrase